MLYKKATCILRVQNDPICLATKKQSYNRIQVFVKAINYLEEYCQTVNCGYLYKEDLGRTGTGAHIP